MKNDLSPLFLRTIALIRRIPKGKVLTYSEVAHLIGAPGCARHISYILSSSSKKYNLPWHRVINSQGRVSLKEHGGGMEQEILLASEKVQLLNGKVDLATKMWKPSKLLVQKALKGIPKHIPYSRR